MFKKIVREIPGGILGSIALFDDLRRAADLCKYPTFVKRPDVKSIMANLFANAIMCVDCSRRRDLIYGVIGLVALIAHDHAAILRDPKIPKHQKDAMQLMTFNGFSKLLAPLMLGDDLTYHVGLQPAPPSPAGFVERPSSAEAKCAPAAIDAASRAKITNIASTTKDLLTVWPEVMQNIRRFSKQGIRFYH